MNTRPQALLAFALVLCATTALAGYRVQYFVGYGVYPPYPNGPEDALLSVNGTHRALLQLIWVGENHVNDGINPFNASGGYVGGDDVVLENRIIDAGVDGVDAWGYDSSPPAPLINTDSLQKPVFVRVHQDATPAAICHWYQDTPLVYPVDLDTSAPPSDTLATIINIETGDETVPTNAMMLDQCYGFTGPLWCWEPDSPSAPEIQYLEFNPATAGEAFRIPYSYSLNAVYGADAALPGGGWDWKLLAEGIDYAVVDDVVTLATAGTGRPKFRIVRLGLIHLF